MRTVMIVLLAVLGTAAAAAGQGDQNLDPVEPVVMAGASYYPSGPTVFFDGAVMVRTGSYKGVSVYVDATKDPYNIIYVPIGSKLMRPYERRSADRAADTLVPAPPLEPVEAERAVEDVRLESPADGGLAPDRLRKPSRNVIARPGDNRGIWIAFDDRIWLLADRQPYPSRALTPNGTYHGFPVYRDPARPNQIFVSSGANGFLARYTLEERR